MNLKLIARTKLSLLFDEGNFLTRTNVEFGPGENRL